MSDPVSNEDIEDVLSSIRRLVSDEPIKGMPRRKSPATENVERFVLTPAFRVADEDVQSDGSERHDSADAAPFAHVEEDGAEAENTYNDTDMKDPNASDEPPLYDGKQDGVLQLDPVEHQPRQEEIDLAPYQSNEEWQEPVPDENDRSVVEQSEETGQDNDQHGAEDASSHETAASEDSAPEHSDHHHAEEAETTDRSAQPGDEPEEAEAQEQHASADEGQGQSQDDQGHEGSEAGLEALFSETESEPAVETDSDTSSDTEPQADSGEQDNADAQTELTKLSDAGQDSLEKRIAELEAALQNSAQEWEPDGSESELTDETRPLSFDTDNDDDGLAEAIASVAETLETAQAESDRDWQPAAEPDTPAPIETLYAKAEPEAAEPDSSAELKVESLQQQPVEWQDLEQERDAALAERLRADAEAELSDAEAQHNTSAMQAEALAAAQAAARAAKENDLFAADEPMMLDEEALQELVADIVRQELQGVLGERITRNVRRLVRREIKRALAMRDLE